MSVRSNWWLYCRVVSSRNSSSSLRLTRGLVATAEDPDQVRVAGRSSHGPLDHPELGVDLSRQPGGLASIDRGQLDQGAGGDGEPREHERQAARRDQERVPHQPEADVPGDRGLPGQGGLSPQPPPEVVGQSVGRGVAFFRVGLQAFQADGFELAVDPRVQAPGARRPCRRSPAPGSRCHPCP